MRFFPFPVSFRESVHRLSGEKGACELGRRNTTTWQAIRSMCQIQQVEEKELYERAKMVLKIYRPTCWHTLGRADIIAEEIECYYCGSSLDTALIYLENFAPKKEKNRFESKVRTLFETKWMIDLIETAMLQVREFPNWGTQYHEILSKCYLSSFQYTENEMLELMGMERSRFYDRKKEAIMLFGLALWGTAIPKLRSFLSEEAE